MRIIEVALPISLIVLGDVSLSPRNYHDKHNVSNFEPLSNLEPTLMHALNDTGKAATRY